MTRTVLIGVDGSSRAEDAIALAVLLAPALEAEPVLFYAHPYGELESLLSDGDYRQLVRGVAETSSRQARSQFGDKPVPRLVLVADRSAAGALHEAAENEDVAAIIVGSSHRGAVGRVFPGGVAQRLLSGAPCPVALAPAGFAARAPAGLGLLGVGFDGSAEASAALRTAAACARANGASLRVIAVHQRLAFGHVPVAADRAFVSVDQQLRADLAERLNTAVAELGMEDRATGSVREGDPAAVLAEESGNLGLLVVGSRGYGPVGSVLVGSVASKLLTRSACPVMVVPQGAGERSQDARAGGQP